MKIFMWYKVKDFLVLQRIVIVNIEIFKLVELKNLLCDRFNLI